MSEKIPPPLYATQWESQARKNVDQPPVYMIPTSFSIGSKRTSAPFITPAQLKGHLGLLHAFAVLKATVEGDETIVQHLHVLADKGRKWAWFVSLAVERFERWCNALQSSDHQDFVVKHLPPLDVTMVWHAYMLNPGWYAEDCTRIPALRLLSTLGKDFAESLPKLGKIYNSESGPSADRVDSWVRKTSTPFDPLEAALQLTHKDVVCPKCRCTTPALFISEKGTGYAQQNFSVMCSRPACKFDITKENLATLKMARDLVRDDNSSTQIYLAGTLRTPKSAPLQAPTSDEDIDRANRIKGAMMGRAWFSRPKGASVVEWEQHLMETIKYSLPLMRTIAGSKMTRSGGRLIGRIISAYFDDRIFSVELVGAVLRQGSFVTKMYDLSWTQASYFDSEEDEMALQHVIARYHAFLDLMASSPDSFFVPTLDIDLGWHTHQLMAVPYGEACIEYISRFVDHDDKVEESKLSTAFDLTCRAWQTRFGVPYTYCGCPLPGESIGQKLSHLIGHHSQRPSYILPPDRPDLLAATHASDHNAVIALHHKSEREAAQRKRRARVLERQNKNPELVKEGKASLEGACYIENHFPAFLVPVPLYYGNVACVAVTGGIVSGNMGGGCTAWGGACAAVGAI